MSFFKNKHFPLEFGGELLVGKRKSRRPISTKRPIHLVIRAQVGQSTAFTRQRDWVVSLTKKYAAKFNIQIYQSGLEYNHLHLVIKTDRRESLHSFLRATTGVLAKQLKIKWIYRPYTRVLAWGRDFKNTLKYVIQNELEGLGLIARSPRKRKVQPKSLARKRVLPKEENHS